MNHVEFTDLAPLHALGALDGAERELFVEHLAACAECRALVAQHEEATAGISAGLQGIAPGAGLKARVMERVREGDPSVLPGPGSRPTSRLTTVLQLAAAVIFLSLWVGKVQETRLLRESLEVEKGGRIKAAADAARESAWAKEQQRLLKEEQRLRNEERTFSMNCQRMALMGTDKAKGAVAMVSWMDTKLEVAVVGMPQPEAGKEYELWAFVEGKDAPMPAGTYMTDEHGHIVGKYTFSGPAPKVTAFAFSMEKAGGVAAPEGPIYMLPAK